MASDPQDLGRAAEIAPGTGIWFTTQEKFWQISTATGDFVQVTPSPKFLAMYAAQISVIRAQFEALLQQQARRAENSETLLEKETAMAQALLATRLTAAASSSSSGSSENSVSLVAAEAARHATALLAQSATDDHDQLELAISASKETARAEEVQREVETVSRSISALSTEPYSQEAIEWAVTLVYSQELTNQSLVMPRLEAWVNDILIVRPQLLKCSLRYQLECAGEEMRRNVAGVPEIPALVAFQVGVELKAMDVMNFRS
jgi:hypothetical protein